ncbi:F-box/FBD/LRR-repeat protein At1g13570-like [Ipomoea triloba]|uniref:F-box/FBD/LRR-repeat protein At1g13570-like n=1 Tax=Ipomoea triloba TaxID=35885 RepID=UPI00125E41CE|nr:F-box/FBD/LRR-repeat protein At1g13570-like [Ipomoea triloba]XP_031121499.1 F-box/FBD/LRR-repeat protein At1g13570-like [Ipomoea triloba]XP_031121501.1 F-box/FBD/LRR-repeat protein At1g13570-like [Ipomoea triloba]XP_031121502.1 F-box/FBD/LRR-repeat protein At1g13570-like [Ipomoea triloba]XP_031121503.1 F-box/FBD/LRR-repeat protein At1g13570-like [Ipomoea triloba]
MARKLKTVADASRDLISELPVEVKDRILECLPTRDAARTALLSSHWNHVWLQHQRLAFDEEFVQSFQQSKDDEGRTLVNIINNILFSRAGPVRRFTLEINAECDPSPLPQQSDIDRWCLFLSRNGVEELNLYLLCDVEPDYQLPFCLLSCRTIKKLIVQGPFINLPVNDCGIFSNVASLAFFNVVFNCSVNGIASSISIPKLEKLALHYCGGINKFEICPPQLEILSVIDPIDDYFDSRWLAPHLKAIKTLWLCGSSLSCMRVSMFPTAINLQVLKLYELDFRCRKQLIISMQLLQKCPNLCELWIMAYEFCRKDDQEAASRLLEDQNGCSFIQELHMLNTIKIEAFSDQSAVEMLFVKMLLSKSPALERVVIVESLRKNASEVVRKIQGKLECFPCASPNAQIVCTSNDYARVSEDWMDTHGVRLY